MTPDSLKEWGEEFMRLSVSHGFSARVYLHYSQASQAERDRWRRAEEANDVAPEEPDKCPTSQR